MPLSQKQLEYVRGAVRRWNFKGGATRSGKTWLDLRWMLPLRIRERAGLDGLVVLMGVTRSTLERNVLSPMRGVFGPDLVGGIAGDGSVRLFGERCVCLGAATAAHAAKLRGTSVKYCYGDEVADWSEEVFALLKSRLDRDCSCFDGTFNPQHPGHWLKRFLDSGADIFCQTYTLDDNPFLSDSFKQTLKNEYQGTVYYDRYILGQWKRAEGLVYPMFDPGRHVVTDCDASGEHFIAVDYGTVNPTAMGLWRVGGGRAVMLREFYHDSRAAHHQKTDEEYYLDLERLAGDFEVARVIVDPSAASFKEVIRRHGRFRVADADNRVLDGIRLTASLLASGRLAFHQSCENTIREFGAYRWDDRAGRDAVVKEDDHSMDQTRYLCQTLRRRFRQDI